MESFWPRKAKILSRIAFTLGIFSFLWAQTATPENADGVFDAALATMIAFENETLEDIVSNSPELLLMEDERGRTLVDNAFLFINDDLAPQTNFDFIRFLIKNNFFDQPVDRTEHFSMAVTSLRMVDQHIRRAGLTEDMIFHKSRLPVVGLLSFLVEDRIKARLFDSQEGMELILAVCDYDAVEGGEEDYFSRSVSTALKSLLASKNADYIAVFVSVGTLDKRCVEGLLD